MRRRLPGFPLVSPLQAGAAGAVVGWVVGSVSGAPRVYWVLAVATGRARLAAGVVVAVRAEAYPDAQQLEFA